MLDFRLSMNCFLQVYQEGVVRLSMTWFFLQVYQEGVVRLSMNCAQEAARRNVKRYIEFSAGQMHSSDKVGHT